MDRLIELHTNGLISEREFLARASKTHSASRRHSAPKNENISSPRAQHPQILPTSLQNAVDVTSVEQQIFMARGLIKDVELGLLTWFKRLEHSEQTGLAKIMHTRAELSDQDAAMLLAMNIKYGLLVPLPGQPAYTGMFARNLEDFSVISISGQSIPVSAYLDPDPEAQWPEQLTSAPPPDSEVRDFNVGFDPLPQSRLVRTLTSENYLKRLPQLAKKMLERRAHDLASHPNVSTSDRWFLEHWIEDSPKLTLERSLAYLLIGLKYQVLEPLPGQTRYLGSIRFNPAPNEVTVNGIPVKPEDLIPGEDWEPSATVYSPVSPYITIGTTLGAVLMPSLKKLSARWADSISIQGSKWFETAVSADLDLLGEFLNVPLGNLKISESSSLPTLGKYSSSSEEIILRVPYTTDALVHELAHWIADKLGARRPVDLTTKGFYPLHAAILDLQRRHAHLHADLDDVIASYVLNPQELWARAFEGYYFAKLGHRDCRVFDLRRPEPLRNFVFWDFDEYVRHIFPVMEDLMVRARLVK